MTTEPVKASSGYVLERGRTESEAKADIAKADRKSWYPGTHASGQSGIISAKDGHEVCRCDRRADRDQIVAMARSHDALREGLSALVDSLSENDQDGLTDLAEPMVAARAALKLAACVK